MEKTRLIQLRKKKNISQQQMAEELCLDVCKDQSVGINNGTNNVYTIPQHILDSQRKYIALLEKKIDELENLTSK